MSDNILMGVIYAYSSCWIFALTSPYLSILDCFAAKGAVLNDFSDLFYFTPYFILMPKFELIFVLLAFLIEGC